MAGWGIGALVSALACGEAAAPINEALCEQGDPTRERHGTDCSCCHEEFGLSGSVDETRGVTHVLIQDGSGLDFEVAINPYGNFFRHLELEAPVEAGIRFSDGAVVMMQEHAEGACNQCHHPLSDLGMLGTRR